MPPPTPAPRSPPLLVSSVFWSMSGQLWSRVKKPERKPCWGFPWAGGSGEPGPESLRCSSGSPAAGPGPPPPGAPAMWPAGLGASSCSFPLASPGHRFRHGASPQPSDTGESRLAARGGASVGVVWWAWPGERVEGSPGRHVHCCCPLTWLACLLSLLLPSGLLRWPPRPAHSPSPANAGP